MSEQRVSEEKCPRPGWWCNKGREDECWEEDCPRKEASVSEEQLQAWERQWAIDCEYGGGEAVVSGRKLDALALDLRSARARVAALEGEVRRAVAVLDGPTHPGRALGAECGACDALEILRATLAGGTHAR